MSTLLECVEINPEQTATATVIWLHGLGADGHDFADIVPMLQLPSDHGIRFIFPHAPVRPVTLNGGVPMRAWFDIHSLERDNRYDREGILQAEVALHQLIEQENQRGIPSNRIILAGFSQGGATILFTGIRYPHRLAGLIALSTFLPEKDFVLESVSPENQNTPIYIAHGHDDPLVKYEWGMHTYEWMKNHNYSVDWHTYPMGHSVCPQEISDISDWCKKILL